MERRDSILTRLTLGLVLLLVMASPLRAQDEISGRVLGPAGVTAIPGARVIFYDLLRQNHHPSQPADAQGTYRLSGLEASRYDVAVETSRGLWLVEGELTLDGSGSRHLSFALRERAFWEGGDGEPPRATPLGSNVVGTAVILESDRQSATLPAGSRRKAVLGTVLGVGVLGLALAAGDSGGEASPFLP